MIYQRREEGEKQQELHQPLTIKQLTISQFKPITPPKTPPQPIPVKNDPVPVKKQPSNPLSSIKKEPVKPAVNELLEIAKNFIKQERYQAAIEEFQKVLAIDPNHTDAAYFIAQIYANQGRYQEAISYCEQLLKIDSLAIAPHYLLARIAEETGKLEEAKYLLKKIIYLDPDSVAAYLDLTHIYEQEGDEKRAIKMYQESLRILRQLPPETPITERGNLTASQLLFQLQKAN